MAEVGEEGEVETVLVAEPAVARHVVGGDPQDHGPLGLQLRGAVAEGAGLLGAAGRVVLGIEVEHHGPAAEVGQPDLPAVIGGHREIRGVVALFDPIGHRGFSSGSEKSWRRGTPRGEEGVYQPPLARFSRTR